MVWKHNTVFETQLNIFETQRNILETQHKIIETQHKIIETQHKIIKTQHKIIECNAESMCDYTTYNSIISQPLTHYAPNSIPPFVFAGADPGEVKWVNFHPPFSESPSLFFFIPQILK